MAVEVFWGSGSPYSWRVLLALEVKSAPYQSRLQEFSKGDLRTPEFLAMNPRGKVPVVREGEFVLHESLAILGWLEHRFPDLPLFGRTPERRAQIWAAVHEIDIYLQRPTQTITDFAYFGRHVDDPKRLQAALEDVHTELRRIEALLDESMWIAGQNISAADVVLLPCVQSLVRAAGKPAAGDGKLQLLPLEEKYPSLESWVAQMEALPGYDRAYPPHWRTG